MATIDGELMDLPFFQTLFDHASDGYIVLDDQLRVRYLNRTAKDWFGEPSSLNDVTCSQLVQCDRAGAGTAAGDKCVVCDVIPKRSAASPEQINVKRKDGRTFPVSVSYSFIPWNNSESFILMSMRDISLQKKLEQERIMKDALHYTFEERERIARDLHDTVAQDLAYTALRLKQLRREWADAKVIAYEDITKEMSEIGQVIDQSIKELRNSLYDLNFELETDFFQFVRDHAIQLELRSGIKTTVEIEDIGMPWADRVEVQLARMIKEVLTNVNKHSCAHHVRLWFKRTKEDMEITIADDGIGFNPEAEESDPRHFGIRSILERCRILGGIANVHSKPGKGTSWEFKIPAHYEAKPGLLQAVPKITIQ